MTCTNDPRGQYAGRMYHCPEQWEINGKHNPECDECDENEDAENDT